MQPIIREAHTYKQILANSNMDYAVPVTFLQQAGAAADVASGTMLGKITASGKYAEYAPGASDGTETCVGILKSAIKMSDLVAGDVAIASYIRGVFLVDKLLLLDAAAIVDLKALSIEGILSF